jgi:glycosyltransferase involved in cell wall biosynthesis
VHWLGLVSNPTALLQASDLFLLATVGEAFGLVLPEAMACGVPVIGARAGAIPEVGKRRRNRIAGEATRSRFAGRWD